MFTFTSNTPTTNSTPSVSPMDLSKSFAKQLNFDEDSSLNDVPISPLLTAITLKNHKSMGYPFSMSKSCQRALDFDDDVTISHDPKETPEKNFQKAFQQLTNIKRSCSVNIFSGQNLPSYKINNNSITQDSSRTDNKCLLESFLEVKQGEEEAKRAVSAPYERTNLNSENISHKGSNLDRNLDQRLSLPMSKNVRDPDLNTISPQTLASLLRGSQTSYLIIDCRYSYEYKGGHIAGALNIESPQVLEQIFFTYQHLLYNPQYIQDLKKDLNGTLSNIESYNAQQQIDKTKTEQDQQLPLIVFHCEFSQKRGPRAFRTLRTRDREQNLMNWPKIDFSEIYVLEGGYSTFYPQFFDLCEGDFVSMADERYEKEYAQARATEKQLWGKKCLLL